MTYAGLYTYIQDPDAQLVGPDCLSAVLPDGVALAQLTGIADSSDGETDQSFPEYDTTNTSAPTRVDWQARGKVMPVTSQVSLHSLLSHVIS